MVWIKSATNGNVFEVADGGLARQLEAAGDEVHKSDPRVREPAKPASRQKE